MLLHNVVCVTMSLASLLLLCYGLFDSGCFFQMKYNEFVKTGMFVYLLSKYVELLDTVFMILRHKQRQITFLHVSTWSEESLSSRFVSSCFDLYRFVSFVFSISFVYLHSVYLRILTFCFEMDTVQSTPISGSQKYVARP